jgi:DNA-binding HxlR family transcriptional regulator
MRSYKQYCAVAKALDVVGDRWTLLIVRELLRRGACRYTDLQNGLPGIATNLLADRLRELERAGIVVREDAPPPIATTLFKLTERGEELRPIVVELGRWGAPLMPYPTGDEAFRGHWFAFPAELFLVDQQPKEPPIAIELRAGTELATIEVGGGKVTTRSGAAEDPTLVIVGSPPLVMGALVGWLSLAEASERGLEYAGDPSALHRIQTGATSAPQRV